MLRCGIFVRYKPHARRGVRGNLSGAYERITPFAIMEMWFGNCITKSKGPYLRNPPTPVGRREVGRSDAMFGKDNTPFQGGKEEKDPSWTGGEGQACADVRASMRLRGLCPHMQNPRLRRGIIISWRPWRIFGRCAVRKAWPRRSTRRRPPPADLQERLRNAAKRHASARRGG